MLLSLPLLSPSHPPHDCFKSTQLAPQRVARAKAGEEKCTRIFAIGVVSGIATPSLTGRRRRALRRRQAALRGFAVDKCSFFSELEVAEETDPKEAKTGQARGEKGQMIFSPTTLSNYMYSPFAAWMDRLRRECPEDPRCQWYEDDEMRSFLWKRGNEVEDLFLNFFRTERPEMRIVDLSNARDACASEENWRALAAEKTTEVLKAGSADLLYQAPLYHPGLGLYGIADFIIRWEPEDGLVQYDIWDTKLAMHPRPSFLAQLAGYAEALELQLRGSSCRGRVGRLGLVLGEERAMKGEVEVLEADEVRPWFRKLWEEFRSFQEAFDPDDDPPDPAETSKANRGSWTSYANDLLQKKDDLALVSGMTKRRRRKLLEASTKTMGALGSLTSGTLSQLAKNEKIPEASLSRLALQARLQSKSRQQRLVASVALPTARACLVELPEDDPGDIFLDLEGMPLKKPGSAREYLVGLVTRDGNFHDWWSTTEAEEQLTFREVVEWILQRRAEYPGMHVYHYGHYEIAAFKRFAKATNQMSQEVKLLVEKVFINLHPVVKRSVALGLPGYGLKNVEHMYKPARETEVATALSSVLVYQSWLDEPDGADWKSSAKLADIREYNKEDCISTMQLLKWLRKRIAHKKRPLKSDEELPEVKARKPVPPPTLDLEMSKALKTLMVRSENVPVEVQPFLINPHFPKVEMCLDEPPQEAKNRVKELRQQS